MSKIKSIINKIIMEEIKFANPEKNDPTLKQLVKIAKESDSEKVLVQNLKRKSFKVDRDVLSSVKYFYRVSTLDWSDSSSSAKMIEKKYIIGDINMVDEPDINAGRWSIRRTDNL